MNTNKHPREGSPGNEGRRQAQAAPSRSAGAGLFGIIAIVAVLAFAGWLFSSAFTAQKPQAAGASRTSARSITVLTGPTSGLYYPIGSAFSTALKDMGYETSVTATGASAENISAILSGKGQLAIATVDVIIQAIEGFGAYEDRPKATGLRAMMGLWPDVVQVVTTGDSGIRSFADLRGRRVGVGALKSGVEIGARMIFEAHGMSYEDASVEFVSTGEAIDMMIKGELDAAFVSSGLGNATIKKLGETRKIAFVPVEGEALQRLIQQHPYFMAWVIPWDVYGTDANTTTAALPNVMLVAEGLPDDVVYDMLRGFYSDKGLRTIAASHVTARDVQLSSALHGIVGTPLRLHPGAQRFYRERGMLQ